MYLSLVLKSLLVGCINALPAGPASIVCIRRTIIRGRMAGMVSGLGMALADALYVIAARTPQGPLQHLVAAETSRVVPLAGLVVIAAGFKILRSKPSVLPDEKVRRNFKGLLASTFLLSVTNFSMLVSLPVLFAALRMNETGPHAIAVGVTVVSVLSGSMAWWSVATQLVGRARCAASEVFELACRLPGIALIIVGVASLSALLA
jgi:threonine/homoserine/homoserine lactone efflux protein